MSCKSATWQTACQQGPETACGPRTVREYIHRSEYELFDLEADPSESTHLAADPEYPTVLPELQEKLEVFRKTMSDPWLMKQMYE